MFCPLFSLPNSKEGLTSDRSVAGRVTWGLRVKALRTRHVYDPIRD